MPEAYILSAVRTPIGVGKPDGQLAFMNPTDLGAIVLNAAAQQAGVTPDVVDDVIWGCVTQIDDQGANLGRLITLKAGFPASVPAVTVNRMCGSSQQALHFGVQAILSGDMDLVVAGGTEMMSHQPIGSDWPERWPDDFPFELVHQGISAELMARKWDLSRGELDDFAYESHMRAMTAIDDGHFDEQIIPIRDQKGNLISTDEGVRRPPDRDAMRRLPPAFEKVGVVTAANSSQVSDGSAAVVLASPKIIGSYNITPRARVIQRHVTGSDPVLMLDGPIEATRSILNKAGMTLAEIDIIEINEAFASVVLAWVQELDADMVKVNPNGGAIALGHPLGATGAILMTKLLHELERVHGQFGLQTMCIGHGMATATIIERI